MIWPYYTVTVITLSRLAFVPLIAWFERGVGDGEPAWSALICYLLAITSDWLDGVLARRWQVTSNFGGMLDETADKIFTTLILLIYTYQQKLGMLGLIAACLLIGRDLLMGGLRYYWASLPAQTAAPSVKVNYLGKVKTFCFMLVLGAYLMNWPVVYLDLGLSITALLSLASLQHYWQRARIAIPAIKT